MIVGTTVIHDGTGTSPYYSPSFPRGGDAALFAVDVTHKSGSPTMVIGIEEKNSDEVSWSSNTSFSAITAAGVATKDATGLKEEIRLAFTFTAGSAGDFFQVVVSAPAWRPYD